MGKYLVTSGSVFTPFSYDEITKPLAQMAEAHGKVQDAYDTIATESEALRHYIEQEPEDSMARAMYDGYMKKLQTLQDNLWQNGYTAQSRRDLSAARAGYASDVTRLASAIKQRQDKSKIFNDARLKDPTLITGRDPGLDPLDRFLKDDTYGSNWYSYSGKDFQKEVSDDAKERVDEWVKENAYLSGVDPNTPGYIMQKVSEGFSSDDVTYARDFASAFAGLYRNPKTRTQAVAIYESLQEGVDFNGEHIPDSSRILTGVLLNHLFASGVMNADVADSELARQINYGANGLSSAIGKTTITNLQDYEWIYANDPSKNKTGKKGSGDDEGTSGTYDPSGVIRETGRTKQAARISERLNESFYGSYVGPEGEAVSQNLIVPGEDGNVGMEVFDNFVDATNYVYRTKERDDILNKYGIDISDSKIEEDKGYKLIPIDEKSRPYLIRTYTSGVDPEDNALSYASYMIEKDGKVDPRATLEVAQATKAYHDRIKQLNELNKDKGIEVSDIAMSPQEEKKLRKKYNIDPRVDWKDVPLVIASQSKSWTVSDATLANHETPDILGNLENWIRLTYQSGGPNGVGSRLAFRRVDPTTGTVFGKGTKHGLKDVFNTDSNGNFKSSDLGLRAVTISPENFENGEITITTDKGSFVCSMDYLGEQMQSSLAGVYRTPQGGQIKLKDAIKLLMMPIEHAEDVLIGEDKFDADAWKDTMKLMFSRETLSAFGMTEPNGHMRNPSDIVRNDNLLANLYQLAVGLIGIKAGFIRDEKALQVYQSRSHTAGKKPITYIEQEEE